MALVGVNDSSLQADETARGGWLGLRFTSHLALFCIHHVSLKNFHESWLRVTAL